MLRTLLLQASRALNYISDVNEKSMADVDAILNPNVSYYAYLYLTASTS